MAILLVAAGAAPVVAQTVGGVIQSTEGASATSGRIVREGIAIDFSMLPAHADDWSRAPRSGDDVVFRFRIADTASGTPLPGANPAAWLERRTPGEPAGADRCATKISTFLGGTLFSAADLDLNVYYVLALNDDASITVVDPLFGFGDTKLLAMIELESPGEDWALSNDERMLFVSMPEAGKLAVIETGVWKVARTIEIEGSPRRVDLQPDGEYVWVTRRGRGGTGSDGVTVVSVATGAVVASIATGDGPHEVAFSDDSRFAFIANAGGGTVSIVDVRELRDVADLGVGDRPVSVDFAPMSRMAYVADQASGVISVVDAERRAVVARIQAAPGIVQIRFPPAGRLGLVANPEANTVEVIDAVSSNIVQTAHVLSGPDQVVFSDELAYIRHRGDATVLTIPLSQLGAPGEPVGTVDFPGGQMPFGAASLPSPADGIVQAPGANAVLIANPADRTIYFYMEGMAAPMGNFANYSRQPRAVLVVDRSLRESRPGSYETVATLREPGTYDVAFFLDTPRVLHCFEVEVEADPAAAPHALPRARVVPLNDESVLRAGQQTTLRFRLTDAESGEPLAALRDVRVLVFLAPGTWQERQWASEIDAAVYAVDFTPPRAGVYYVYLEVASLGLQLNNSQYSILRVVEDRSGAAVVRRTAAAGEEIER